MSDAPLTPAPDTSSQGPFCCRIMEGMESQIVRPGHLTAHQTARVLGVELTGLRSIVHRGQLTRSGGTPRQPWYAATDVAALAAKRAARASA